MSAGAHARNIIRPLLTGSYRFRVIGGHHLPRRGGVLIVSDQVGILDPTIVATALVRPVRVLSQVSVPRLRWSPLTLALGRIDIPATGSVSTALHEGVAALNRGEAVGVFVSTPFGKSTLTPQSAVAAYLHARTNVPIVPVTLFGNVGERPTDLPRPRSLIECHLGSPAVLPAPTDLVNANSMRQHAERMRQVCRDARDDAERRTGRDRRYPRDQNGHRD